MTTTANPQGQPDQSNRLRRNTVPFAGVLAQSLSVMAPAMSAAFITYLAAVKAGAATPLSFVFAAGACLLIGGVVAAFAAQLPSAGSLYTFVTHGLNPTWGFVVGWCYAIALALACPAVVAGFSVFTSLVMTDLGAPGPLTEWTFWFALGVAACFALSWFGIELSSHTQVVFTIATVAVLLVLAGAVIGQGGAHGNTLDAFSPGAAGVGWSGVFAGMAFGILSFVGFETAATLAEETRNPRRMVPLAVMGSVGLGGAFYIVVTYATSIGYGVPEASTAWPQSAAGIVALAEPFAGYLANWALLAGAISALLCALGVHNAGTRTVYAMGRDGVLPSALGRTHPRYGTPHVAIAVNVALTLAIAAVLIAVTPQGARDAVGATPGPLSAGFYLFAEGLTIITPLFVGCYALLSVAGVRDALRDGRADLTRRIAVALGAFSACAVALYGALYYCFVAPEGASVPGPYRAVPILAGLVLTSGLACAVALRRRRPTAWEGMGAVFE
ncbi:MAG: amino acid permease [Sporichthyaceae bacterium]